MSGYAHYQLKVQDRALFEQDVSIDGTLTIGGIVFPGTFTVDMAALQDRVAVLEAAAGTGDGTEAMAARLGALETSDTTMASRMASLESTETDHNTAAQSRMASIETLMGDDRAATITALAGATETCASRDAAQVARIESLEASGQAMAERVNILETSSSSGVTALAVRVASLEDKVPSTVNDVAARVALLEAAPAPATPASVTSLGNRVTALENKPAPAPVASVTAVADRVTALETKPLINATRPTLPKKTALDLAIAARVDAITDALVAAGLARYST